jgi:hypothetical protein
MKTIAIVASQIANDTNNGNVRGTMISSIHANLEDASKAMISGNAEVARASVLRAAKYAYGIMDTRYATILAAV